MALADLLLADRNRATAGAVRSLEAAAKRWPRPDGQSALTAWGGALRCGERFERMGAPRSA